jgi:Na+-transporting methylmalonyl-CoA/oxaloacetate decarboxylase gamma subunit
MGIMMEYLKKLQVIAVLVLLFCAIGCMSDEANRFYLKERLPAKNVEDVEVLWAAPERPYTVIADFQANKATVKHMRKRAAEVGADAVIVVPAGGWYSRKEVWADEDRHSDSYKRLTATAIIYKTEE